MLFFQIHARRKDKSKLKKSVIIFVICFLLALFSVSLLVSNNLPYSWTKTSLSINAVPKNVERGNNVFFSGALGGDDVADKTMAMVVTDVQGSTMATFSTQTGNDGFFNYTWLVPANCSVGKHDISVSFELLGATDNFMVKLAAPQKYGGTFHPIGYPLWL